MGSTPVRLHIVDEDDKGDEIRFRGGAYHGHFGWLNKGYPKDALPQKANVIVFIKMVNSRRMGAVEKGVYTQVYKSNIESIYKPTCYEEAVIQQDKKVEKYIGDLARRLAAFGITGNRPGKIFDKIKQRMDEESKRYTGPIGWNIDYEGPDDPRQSYDEIVLEEEEEMVDQRL